MASVTIRGTTASSAPIAPRLPACLYCAGEAYEPRYDHIEDRLRYVPGKWAFHRCVTCGSVTLAPHPRPEGLAAFYPPVYSFTPELGEQSWFKRWLARAEYRFFFSPQFEAQARRVLRGTGQRDVRGQRLLVVGCGRGLRLLAFRRRGFEVQGMDFQPEVVDYLRNQLGIEAVCTDVEGLTRHFSEGSFDLVTAFCVLEHVPDVAAVLRSCRQLLKPGGWFVGTVPLIDSFQAWLFGRRWIDVTEAPRHLSLPSREGLAVVCRRAGFESVAVRPDSTWTCAGLAALSMFPGASTTHLYGGGKLRGLATRLLAGLASVLAIPWTLAENYLLHRPARGMVFARKPA